MPKTRSSLVAAAALAACCLAQAAVSAEEARQLGTTLTPVGAERAGNKEGTIPAYGGGLTTAPAGFDKAKGVRPDPFAAEKPLFSIDGKNADKHGDKLSEGAKALLKNHASFRMDVYPTHRTVAYPKYVLDATAKNATAAKTDAEGMALTGARTGVPFPIPKSGHEAMWNFLTRFMGPVITIPHARAYNVDATGKVTLSSDALWYQEQPNHDADKPGEQFSRVQVFYSGPARRAGEAIMVKDPLDFSVGRRSWQYLPGQRRVRLAPDIAYDTPNPGTGMSTYDDVNIFNGKMDRFDFKLVGKKEMYIPYNAYRMVYAANAGDVFKPKHLNPDLVRWELHRVWVVEAKLKEGKNHIYSRRTFYLDEDSWAIAAVDQYDGRGQLWRPGFSYMAPAYDAPSPSFSPSGHYDLVTGSYYVNLWPGTDGIRLSAGGKSENAWSPDVLAGTGVR